MSDRRFSELASQVMSSLRLGQEGEFGQLPLSRGNSLGRMSPSDHLLLEVSRQAVELKQLGADSLAVVLKPDAKTEVFLHLTQRDGVVEVFARFERGDFDALNAHWSQMQQALSSQGIRLGQLQESASSERMTPGLGGNGFDASSGENQPRWERPEAPETLDELPLVGSVTEPLRRRSSRTTARHRRSWESWA